MKFSEMPYQRPDLEELKSGFEELTAAMRAASSAEEQIELFLKMDKQMASSSTQSTIVHIRNTVDTRDEFYEKEREFWDNAEPVLVDKTLEFQNAALESPFRPALEERFGSLMFRNFEMEKKGFSPELIPLIQEENAIAAEYQKLYASAQIPFMGKTCTIAQLGPYKENPDRDIRKAAYKAEGGFFDEHREEFDSLFDRLVKNRTEQAHKLGFKNYVELGYIRRTRNCYGPEEVANFRRQVLEDLVPVVNQIKKSQAGRIGIEELKFYDDLFTFRDGNAVPQGTPDELLAAAKKMYTEMSPETAEFIQLMFENDLFDVLAKDGKAPGGYCTSLADYHAPFIFSNFNGTSGDVDVLTHEAGHAFAFFVADKEIELSQNRHPTMEGCETHSMSMEFLTSPWHELFFKHQTAKYELSHAEDAITFIPYGTMVDYFQELVYSKPEMTPEERNQVWAELEKQFRPYVDFDNLPFYGRGAGWQRQLHIYLYPFYYIDYCMAQTIALQFWVESLKDRKLAWEKYLAFVKKGGTLSFVDLVKSAGLRSPLESGALKEIATAISQWFSEHQI